MQSHKGINQFTQGNRTYTSTRQAADGTKIYTLSATPATTVINNNTTGTSYDDSTLVARVNTLEQAGAAASTYDDSTLTSLVSSLTARVNTLEQAATNTGSGRYQVLPHESGVDHWMGGQGAGINGEFNFRLAFYDSQAQSVISAYDLCVAEGYIDNTQSNDLWTGAASTAGIVDKPHWFYHDELKLLQTQIYDTVCEIFLGK